MARCGLIELVALARCRPHIRQVGVASLLLHLHRLLLTDRHRQQRVGRLCPDHRVRLNLMDIDLRDIDLGRDAIISVHHEFHRSGKVNGIRKTLQVVSGVGIGVRGDLHTTHIIAAGGR